MQWELFYDPFFGAISAHLFVAKQVHHTEDFCSFNSFSRAFPNTLSTGSYSTFSTPCLSEYENHWNTTLIKNKKEIEFEVREEIIIVH